MQSPKANDATKVTLDSIRATLARRILGVGVALVAGSVLLASVGPARAEHQDTMARAPHIMRDRNSKLQSGKGNLIYHNGPVMSASKIYTIYWGNTANFPGDLKNGMEQFFGNLSIGGTNDYSGIVTQYVGAGGPVATYVTAVNDPTAPPKHPSTSTIVNEACAQYGSMLDSEGIYVVFTSNAPNGSFCAWHSYGTCNGVSIPVVYMPNVSGISGCQVAGINNGYSQATQSMANIAAHEWAETVTDEFISAWYDSSGQEIGDKCNWNFSGTVTLNDGSLWMLQELWSNSISGCAQTSP